MPLLEVRSVAKRFGGVAAVAGMSLEVGEDEIVGLIGPNGAGKTTSFNSITGLLKIDEGEILLEVVKLDPIFFSFPIASDVVTALEKEKGVEVAVRLKGMTQDLTGEIAALGVEEDAVEGEPAGFRRLSAKVRIPNSDFSLKPDLEGSAEIRTTAKRKLMVVPSTAVVKGDKTNYIFRVEGNLVRVLPVEVGPDHNNHATIVKGLNAGDTIVAAAHGDLRDGSEIEIEAIKSALP